jgi:hypothetical protein
MEVSRNVVGEQSGGRLALALHVRWQQRAAGGGAGAARRPRLPKCPIRPG